MHVADVVDRLSRLVRGLAVATGRADSVRQPQRHPRPPPSRLLSPASRVLGGQPGPGARHNVQHVAGQPEPTHPEVMLNP
jgi:hypothetical protein